MGRIFAYWENGLFSTTPMTFGAHESANHKRKEYVKWTESGEKATTNAVEGYFSILKHGVHGVCHHMSKRHFTAA